MGRIGILVLVLLAALLAASCGGGGGSTGRNPTIRSYNGSPDAPELDFLRNDDVIAAALAFLTGQTEFTSIEPGLTDISVRITGTTDILDSLLLDFPRDVDTVCSTLGLLDYGTEPEKRLRIVVNSIDRRAPNGNVARLNIYHGFIRAPGFSTPNIDFQNPGENPQFRAPDIEFAGTAQLLVDAVPQTFQARRAGSEEVYAEITLQPGDIEAGKVYVVYVLGIEGGSGNQSPRIVFEEVPTR